MSTGLETGTVIAGRYRLVELLARGGMGVVYRAEDLKLGDAVALKFLPRRFAADAEALSRFHREVRIARKITHPNVCRVYDIGEWNERPFLSMEYIDGEDLASLRRRIGQLPPTKAVEVARQICYGLAAAHERGILHRDLKPANVMFDSHGQVKLTDFGLAVLASEDSQEGTPGTPVYMSPEQLRGEPIGVESDLYSLGLVLYELVTGERPFAAGERVDPRSGSEIQRPASVSEIVAGVSPELEQVIADCLESRPRDRPSSALSVAAGLPGGDPLQAVLAAGETPSPEMVASARRSGTLSPAAGVACFSVLVGALLANAALFPRFHPIGLMHLPLSPNELEDSAKQVLRSLDYTLTGVDDARGFSESFDYFQSIRETDTAPYRWDRLRRNQPPPLEFWYRQSPVPLRPVFPDWDPGVEDPAPPGSATVYLDPEGRLRSLSVSQLPYAESVTPPSDGADWAAVFELSGLDASRFRTTPSVRTPRVHSDTRRAWTGFYPEAPEIEIRVEAASLAGVPVYWEIFEPWDDLVFHQPDTVGARFKIAQRFLWITSLGLLIAALLVVRRNLRTGRSDRQGGLRLATFVFLAHLIAWAVSAPHRPELSYLGPSLGEVLAGAFRAAGVLWLFYTALEPFIRRRWPESIISWSRLLSGRARDPLVGRDLLVGALVAVIGALVWKLGKLLALELGYPIPMGDTIRVRYLVDVRSAVPALNHLIFLVLGNSFRTMFGFLVLFVLLRKNALAVGAFFLLNLFTSIVVLGATINPVAIAAAAAIAALQTWLIVRFGLVAVISWWLFTTLLNDLPMSLDLSHWYSVTSVVSLVVLTAIGWWSFRTATGAQSLLPSGE